MLANLAAEIEAADAGQHNIEKKQRWLRPGRHGNHRRPREKCGDLVSGGSQVEFDQARHIGIVFHDVDQVGATPIAGRVQMFRVQKESLGPKGLCLERADTLKGRLINKTCGIAKAMP